MKSIYIVLSHSNTIVSKIIKRVTKDKYSHVSLSLDDSCEQMYSFGRKYIHLAIIGCFNVENIKTGIYKIHKNSTMAIYKLDVNDTQYNNIMNKVDEISKNSNGYNIIGLFLAYFHKRVRRNKYYCSEFVYDVLSDKSINVVDKSFNIFKPCEFLKLSDLELVYEGRVCDYRRI